MNPKRTYGDEEPSVSLPKRLRTFNTASNGGIYLNRDAYSPLVHGDYTIAWICALPLELAASRAMLDEEHPLPPNQAGDDNIYVLGRIDQHNVVMTCLPGQYGTNNAAIVATNLKRSFPSIRATLMVGIGGGSPTQADLYLGDVVVGTRVIQYDMGKMTAGGLFQGTADTKTPARLLNSAVSALQSKHRPHHSSSQMTSILRSRLPHILRPNHPDRLFQASYKHPFGEPTCVGCDPEKLQPRGARLSHEPRIHYGVIASGNRVMKDGRARDDIALRLLALCFEMEAAGMMDNLQCLPIRGICDYSDSHKNKEWQDYAAATAAAYARELLEGLPPSSRTPDRTPTYITHASQPDTAGNANHRQFQDPSSPPETRSCAEDNPTSVDDDIGATLKESLVERLFFSKIDERLTSLTAAQGKTCRWFLTKPEYAAWRDVARQSEDGGFLWIKGHPGTGKSTLMKLLFEEAKRNAKSDPSQIILSFFFLARGALEEKSTAGLYRSILHQLLDKAADLKDSLDWMTGYGARRILQNGWHDEALKQTLTHAVSRLGNRSLTIFVDALDECDQSQAAGMVCFFEELCDCARDADVRLQICFSSRHYPTIVIEKGIEVTLEAEDGHTEDIQQYIKSKLRLGKSKHADILRSEILEKSSGIFLWVVLVLDILSNEYPNTSVSLSAVRNRLKKIPSGLNDLFEMVLARDGKNLERLHICLKWVLFATRPLKPQEFYFAIQIGLGTGTSGYWDQEDVELDQMKTFVRTSSKGLAEVTRNKSSEVQFIHESVRDFLLGRYGGEWSKPSGNFEGQCHNMLRDCCLAQLNAPIHESIRIPPLPLPQTQAAQLKEDLNLKFPFLEYSVINVLRHANSAQQHGMEQDGFLAIFPLPCWRTLNNAFERKAIRRYSESVNLLYILAEKDLADLIRIHPQNASCFDVGGERYGPPIFAALATESHQAVHAMLDSLQAQARFLDSPPCDLWAQYREDEEKRTDFGRTFVFSRRRGVLSHIQKPGYEAILLAYLSLGRVVIHAEDASGRTPLSWAAECGHDTVMRLLLEAGAEVNTKDYSGRTPLSWAPMSGRDAVVKLLLEAGAKVDAKDHCGRTPLSCAAEKGYQAPVLLLHEAGAEIDARDNIGRAPLSWAAGAGYEALVRLLLEAKAEVDIADYNGRTALSRAAEQGSKTVVSQLLENGADINSKDRSGRTPLSWSAARGHGPVVELLLKNGPDVDSKDNDSGQTPLSWSAAWGHEAVVELLLKNGADVDSKDKKGRTPLSWSAGRGYKALVELLLKNSADVDLKDDDLGQTPLSWSAARGHEAVVELLLKNDVDVNSKDKKGRTPLSWAAETGLEAIVRLLLEAGAQDVNLKDNSGRTPQSYVSNVLSSRSALADYQMQLMLLERKKSTVVDDRVSKPAGEGCFGANS
jgi:ankyrin repeat protein/nucleoside phosphorylase